jgi:hypothetical protein
MSSVTLFGMFLSFTFTWYFPTWIFSGDDSQTNFWYWLTILVVLSIMLLGTNKIKFFDLEILKFLEFKIYVFSMANRYYRHQSVRNPQEASIFSNVYTWTILDILRDAGAKGLTAESVHKGVEGKMRTSVSRSKIYDLLKRMYEQEWIHRYYDNDVQARCHVIAQDWGGIDLDKDYDQAILNKERNYFKETLFPRFLDLIKKSMEDLKEDSVTSKWLPQSKDLCKVCRTSHEAHEFFTSLLDIASAEFMESDEFLEFVKEYGFTEKEY